MSNKLRYFTPTIHAHADQIQLHRHVFSPKDAKFHQKMKSATLCQLLALGVAGSHARHFEFPPGPALQLPLERPPRSLESDADVDILTGSQFRGLRTFANLPYVNCFSDEEMSGKDYDIAIMGAPFDTVSRCLAGRDSRVACLTCLLDGDRAAGR